VTSLLPSNQTSHHKLPFTVEFAVLTVDPETKAPKAKIYRPAEIDALLQSEGLAKKDDDDTAMRS
jgi:20S proteasome subunit alpha 3